MIRQLASLLVLAVAVSAYPYGYPSVYGGYGYAAAAYHAPVVAPYAAAYHAPIAAPVYHAPVATSYHNTYRYPSYKAYAAPIYAGYHAPVVAPYAAAYHAPIVPAYGAYGRYYRSTEEQKPVEQKAEN